MTRQRGFTLIEMLVVISIISILAGILLPALGKVRTAAKVSSSSALIRTISLAIQTYSNDFSGSFPPDTLGGTVIKRCDDIPLNNTSQCLSYFLESDNLSDDGRKSGNYISFKPSNKKLGEQDTFELDNPPIELNWLADYIVDAFRTPVVYDERKSEEDIDGLNSESFVLISGGAFDEDRESNLEELDDGDVSMFNVQEKARIDTEREDYEDEIPPLSTQSNDDIFNR